MIERIRWKDSTSRLILIRRSRGRYVYLNYCGLDSFSSPKYKNRRTSRQGTMNDCLLHLIERPPAVAPTNTGALADDRCVCCASLHLLEDAGSAAETQTTELQAPKTFLRRKVRESQEAERTARTNWVNCCKQQNFIYVSHRKHSHSLEMAEVKERNTDTWEAEWNYLENELVDTSVDST
jgi:hypothetical protein